MHKFPHFSEILSKLENWATYPPRNCSKCHVSAQIGFWAKLPSESPLEPFWGGDPLNFSIFDSIFEKYRKICTTPTFFQSEVHLEWSNQEHQITVYISEDYVKSTLKSMFWWKIIQKKWSKCEKSTLVILTVLLKRFYDVLCDDTLLFMLLGILQLRLSSEHEHFWGRHPLKPVPKTRNMIENCQICFKKSSKMSKNHVLCFYYFFIILYLNCLQSIQKRPKPPQKYFWRCF